MGITVFTPSPKPANETRRSEAALNSGLLGRVNDPILRAIAKDARRDFDVRWSGIGVLIGEVQHIIASSDGLIGLYRRSTTFSSYIAFNPNETFVLLDARADERFTGNPHVDDGLVRFYAGTAIFDRAGYAIGALCISDSRPRQSFGEDNTANLRTYALKVSKSLL